MLHNFNAKAVAIIIGIIWIIAAMIPDYDYLFNF